MLPSGFVRALRHRGIRKHRVDLGSDRCGGIVGRDEAPEPRALQGLAGEPLLDLHA